MYVCVYIYIYIYMHVCKSFFGLYHNEKVRCLYNLNRIFITNSNCIYVIQYICLYLNNNLQYL